ncbi:hypothetical protein [Synechococcus elongatus]|uniref:hypothetical protein n=1 Tax=Synechococcus elongatus TaxID=32046 RepID=UPI0012DD41A1|nr:hypothetical protein [Synechococcus elongatus]MBD2588668.1 hypothetical protein [Synechococcus elongatus FACHB-242]MBD2708350.1 hypothetical protein [Synechococcus elongatus PCC 7942 = FACHB-805]
MGSSPTLPITKRKPLWVSPRAAFCCLPTRSPFMGLCQIAASPQWIVLASRSRPGMASV